VHLNSREISKARVAIIECQKKEEEEIKGQIINRGKVGNTSGNI